MSWPTSGKKRRLFGSKKGLKCSFKQPKIFYSWYFLPTSWILLKQLLLSPSWPLSQKPIQPSASWAIDSEPIRARGIIIVKYPIQDLTSLDFNVLSGRHLISHLLPTQPSPLILCPRLHSLHLKPKMTACTCYSEDLILRIFWGNKELWNHLVLCLVENYWVIIYLPNSWISHLPFMNY